MGVDLQLAGTVIGIITGCGTIASWIVLLRKRGNRVPSRQRPKGAWERVAAISALTRVSNDSYVAAMASSAAKVAAEAEAFAAVRNSVKIPVCMVGVYLGLGVLAFWPSFSLGTLTVSILGIIVFVVISSANALRNLRDKASIHTLVEEENDLILRNPSEALWQHARKGRTKQDVANRLLGKGLRRAATKITEQRDELKRRAVELDEREQAIEQRERMLAANWRLRRG